MQVEFIKLEAPPLSSKAIGLAEVKFTFDNGEQMVVGGLKIFRSHQNTLWIGYPHQQFGGQFVPIFLASKLLQRMLEDAIFPHVEEFETKQRNSVSSEARRG